MIECILTDGLACDTPDACAEHRQCRIQAAAEAEARRKLLSAKIDGGIIRGIAEITAWLSLHQVDLDGVTLILDCHNYDTGSRLDAALRDDTRLTDLMKHYVRRDKPNFGDGFRLMGMHVRTTWPEN